MKQFIATFILLSFCVSLATAQKLIPIKDPHFKGVKTYTSPGYAGAATSCTDLNATYTFPNGISSVKVYGAWKLVNQSSGLAIAEDDSHYNGSGTGTWKLEKTSDKYYGIAYSEEHFQGQATYLKMFKNENLHEDMKSLKLNLPANIGWTDASGYQVVYQAGKFRTLPKDLARADLHIKYLTIPVQRVTN